MRVTSTLEFPELQEILENAETMDGVWNLLIEWFSQDPNDLQKIACANKLIELNNMRQSDLIQELDNEFHELKDVVRQICRESPYGADFTVSITRRQKALIKLFAKMILLIKEGEKAGKNVFSSLEGLRDFLGIKIVVEGSVHDTPEAQRLCYDIMNGVLQYLVVKKKNTLATVNYNKNVWRPKEVLVPAKSEILPIFTEQVKDYIYHVKKSLYQCLHAIPTNPNKQTIEIQVRTMAMDIRAEYNEETSHEKHDVVRYEGIDIPLDLTKVSIKGFAAYETERTDGTKKIVIYDKVGLTKSIDPLNLLR